LSQDGQIRPIIGDQASPELRTEWPERAQELEYIARSAVLGSQLQQGRSCQKDALRECDDGAGRRAELAKAIDVNDRV
jgi:hypothetical protein